MDAMPLRFALHNANSVRRGGGRESKAEVVSINDLLMQRLFSHEG